MTLVYIGKNIDLFQKNVTVIPYLRTHASRAFTVKMKVEG